jgi:hypothetical protein
MHAILGKKPLSLLQNRIDLGTFHTTSAMIWGEAPGFARLDYFTVQPL